jgi:O-antigen/teichoic acid export membrane protein
MRWSSRLIGVLSTLILARLLLPADFGIAAMAWTVIGFVSVLLDLGVNVALIRNADATEAHFHSAWTLRLAQAALVALVLLAVAPFAGDYFHDRRVVPVLMVLALNVLIASFENIGVISFQKEMQFGLEFRYLLTNRVFGFIVTVVAALVLRNYWALVAAGIASSLFTVANSYRVHPIRPRLSTKKLREILSVSQWMLLQNVGNYLDDSLHKLVVGNRESAATMGAYSLASEISAMPSTELLQPLNRVLFPAFVAASHDLDRLKRTFLLAQGVQVLVALPASVFLSLLAPSVVAVLLGPKWSAAAPLLQALALASAIQAVKSSAWYVSITLTRERVSAGISWMQVVLFVLLAFVAMPSAGATGIAQLRVVVPAIGLVFQLWVVSRGLGNLAISEFMAGLWRPGLAVAFTAAAYLYGVSDLFAARPALHLALGGPFCAGAYVLCLWFFKLATRRLSAPEQYLVSILGPLLARSRRPHAA